MYFIITNSDGDTYVTPITEEELLEDLEEREGEGYAPKFITKEELKSNHDPNYWGENGMLIIKGEVIIPKPKEKILSYEL